jgi:molybdenum cofactor synthesis domain-containing protein
MKKVYLSNANTKCEIMRPIELEIICIGNELLIGKTLNTNANWMAKRATQIGLGVRRITVIPDEIEEIAMAIKESLKRKPSFVITTGGLGPTFDDKTLEGLALALNRELKINKKALKMVKEKYETYARKSHTETVELTKPRLKMATLPKKTLPIPNPVGTAPGVQAELKETTLIALPGVPKEMEAIFEEAVEPILRQVSGNRNFHEKSIYAEGIMESGLAPLIDAVMKDNPGVYVKSHPKGEENRPHIEIHFSSTLGKAEKPKERLDKAIKQLSEEIKSIGGRIVSEI